ncbi:unnamed protein product [Prorocentrum cordatum]|uniref:Uncharacterized protein n=1 Tax=Prorocentrum cordatum TaxID=2364126 RepID=A0ABN9YBZ2_9DINO|nr:unnamed protein product [Polarella glacialis]
MPCDDSETTPLGTPGAHGVAKAALLEGEDTSEEVLALERPTGGRASRGGRGPVLAAALALLGAAAAAHRSGLLVRGRSGAAVPGGGGAVERLFEARELRVTSTTGKPPGSTSLEATAENEEKNFETTTAADLQGGTEGETTPEEEAEGPTSGPISMMLEEALTTGEGDAGSPAEEPAPDGTGEGGAGSATEKGPPNGSLLGGSGPAPNGTGEGDAGNATEEGDAGNATQNGSLLGGSGAASNGTEEGDAAPAIDDGPAPAIPNSSAARDVVCNSGTFLCGNRGPPRGDQLVLPGPHRLRHRVRQERHMLWRHLLRGALLLHGQRLCDTRNDRGARDLHRRRHGRWQLRPWQLRVRLPLHRRQRGDQLVLPGPHRLRHRVRQGRGLLRWHLLRPGLLLQHDGADLPGAGDGELHPLSTLIRCCTPASVARARRDGARKAPFQGGGPL